MSETPRTTASSVVECRSRQEAATVEQPPSSGNGPRVGAMFGESFSVERYR